MEKDKLIELIERGLSTREIGQEVEKSQGSVKHWLNVYGLKTLFNKHNKKGNDVTNGSRMCISCKETKLLTDFYLAEKKSLRYQSECKVCSNRRCSDRVVMVKNRMIEYKGSQCVDCGLKSCDTHYSVFEFHHLDPRMKDTNFSKIKYHKWDVITKELEKCVLLCANCHRIRHHQIGV